MKECRYVDKQASVNNNIRYRDCVLMRLHGADLAVVIALVCVCVRACTTVLYLRPPVFQRDLLYI